MQLVLELPQTAFSASRLSPKEYVDEMRRAAVEFLLECHRFNVAFVEWDADEICREFKGAGGEGGQGL